MGTTTKSFRVLVPRGVVLHHHCGRSSMCSQKCFKIFIASNAKFSVFFSISDVEGGHCILTEENCGCKLLLLSSNNCHANGRSTMTFPTLSSATGADGELKACPISVQRGTSAAMGATTKSFRVLVPRGVVLHHHCGRSSM